MSNSEFHKITLPIENNLFDELLNSIEFENIAKGRVGNHLVNVEDKGVPIVRTTTKYNIPAQNFSTIHHKIVASINNIIKSDNLINLPLMDFNNALIEVYDCNYSKMNYHSDQCLDLDSNSYIGLFSCYETPNQLTEKNLRKLIVKDKVSNDEFEISLTHNSVVLFSLETNTKFLHKIILEALPNPKSLTMDNKWLGITFRKSKTFIQFKDNIPYFPNGELFELANDEQQSEFYKLRGQENYNLNFVYPKLTYTLSMGDTLIPKNN